MIWISEVLPPSTKEELPPYMPEFAKQTEKAKADFQDLLDGEMERINDKGRMGRGI